MNVIALSGRLTQDPILRHTNDNVSVASFTIAVKRPGTKDKTDFIDCTAWHNNANFVSKYFFKGKRIEVVGCLVRDDYTKQDGTKVKDMKVRVDKIHFGDDKRDEEREQRESEEEDHTEPQSEGFSELQDDDDGELPF